MKPLNLSKPHLIVIVGIPGSGRSFFAEHFGDTFKAPIVSCDRIRNELFQTPTYDKIEDEAVNRVANNILSEILKTERTVVFDGHIYTRSDRDLIARKARGFGYEPLFVWVQTDPGTAKRRAIKSIDNKPTISPEQFEAKLKRFCAPHRIENTIVISGKHTYPSQLKNVLKYLAEPRWQIRRPISITPPARSRNV